MTHRLTPDATTQRYWTALWKLTRGRLAGDSLACSLATADLVPLLSAPTQALVVAVDAVTDAVTEWADQIDKNPACMAEATFQGLHAQLDPPQRLLLFAAHQLLMAHDPTGESGAPHSPCHPWPAQAAVPSLAHAGGGQLLPLAVQAAGQTHGLEDNAGFGLVSAAAGVLTQLAWALGGSTDEGLRAVVEAKSGA